MRICGIDPGLRHTGWGIVDIEGSTLKWVADGTINPDPHQTDAERLADIHAGLKAVISRYAPDRAAVEEIFVARNAGSALKLGMARGVAILTLADAGLAVSEIAARRVKQNITGSGRADKTQVTAMVSRLLGVTPQSVDSADALAIAIAASHDSPETVAEATEGAAKGDVAEAGLAAASGGGLEAAIARALAKESAS